VLALLCRQIFDHTGTFRASNALDRCPDDRQATHLGGEHVNLVGALTDVAEQTLDGVGRSEAQARSASDAMWRKSLLSDA